MVPAPPVPPGQTARPLEITFTGDVYTLSFELNNPAVTLHGGAGSTFTRTFSDFPAGSLAVLLHTKGLNGTAWTLSLKYDGKSVLDEKGTIAGGFSHLLRTVVLK